LWGSATKSPFDLTIGYGGLQQLDEAHIGQREAEALALSKHRRTLAVLDDKEARAIAKAWNLEYTSTVMVLFEAFKREVISYDDLAESLAKLSGIIWISTDVITEVIRIAKEVRR